MKSSFLCEKSVEVTVRRSVLQIRLEAIILWIVGSAEEATIAGNV